MARVMMNVTINVLLTESQSENMFPYNYGPRKNIALIVLIPFNFFDSLTDASSNSINHKPSLAHFLDFLPEPLKALHDSLAIKPTAGLQVPGPPALVQPHRLH